MDEPYDLRISSLDLTVYAYLKEEIVNTEESEEVKYLRSKCPNLMKFYNLMDFLFTESTMAAYTDDQTKITVGLCDEAKSAKGRFFRTN